MPYKFSDIEKRLSRLGFIVVRQKWSHVLFSNGSIIFPVPKHAGKDISLGVEKNILNILWVSAHEFKNIL